MTTRLISTPENGLKYGMPILKAKFYRRLAASMRREGEIELEVDLINRANRLDHEGTLYYKGI